MHTAVYMTVVLQWQNRSFVVACFSDAVWTDGRE